MKDRGLRRYYNNLLSKNDFGGHSRFIDFADMDFYLAHAHFDLRGYGNLSFKRRKPHLDKLCRHFDLLADKAIQLNKNFQLWAVIFDFDSQSDALFLHTENPFPHKVEDLSENCTLTNIKLIEYLRQLSGFKLCTAEPKRILP